MQLFDTPQIDMLDADVQYYPNWLGINVADVFFAQLKQNLSWSQDYIRIYGRDVKIPRLQCWMGDPDATYTYSGLLMTPLAWAEPVLKIKAYCQQETGHAFNSVLANWYRDGQDSMGMHSDDEPELGSQPVIASVTLGEPRKFIFKHKQLGTKHEIPLAHGSLLVMRGDTQQYWQHGINKTKRAIDDRINLTFRHIRSTI
jgi:alkylated DNA repair dioxygenase AlkB